MTKFTKTAKYTIIRQTSNNINEIYSKGYREVPSKVTRIAKITKFTKTAKFRKIRKTIDKVYVIYSKGCREALSKVTRIAKMTKFTKTAKFTIIHQTSHNINEIYSRGYENCEIYEIYENSQDLTKSIKFIQRVAGRPCPKLRELRK